MAKRISAASLANVSAVVSDGQREPQAGSSTFIRFAVNVRVTGQPKGHRKYQRLGINLFLS